MYVLSRRVGESVIIEEVALTLARLGDGYAEISLAKIAGGSKTILTLTHQERKAICYDVELVLVAVKDDRARFGFEYPPEVTITRKEFLESSDDRRG